MCAHTATDAIKTQPTQPHTAGQSLCGCVAIVSQQQQVFAGQHVLEDAAAGRDAHSVNQQRGGGGVWQAEECTLDMLPSSSSAPR